MTQFDRRQLADRARLARELHDGIAQDLVGVGYSLDLLLADPETSVDARSQLRTLRFTVSDLIDKVRREIYYLRQPATLTLDQGIRSAAEEICKDLDVKLEIDDVPLVLDSEISYEITRIAQEILRNIAAHAQANTVTVSLHNENNGVELCIADDGIGGAVVSDERYGIQSIRDRALALNGSVEIQSNSAGTCVSLRVPTKNHANR